MVRYLDLESVIRINRRFSDGGVRDLTALRSAVGELQQGAFGQEFHRTIDEKAAALLRGVARNHAFVDGNKRTALATVGAFYKANGYELRVSDAELVQLTVDVARGRHELPEITKRLEGWKQELRRDRGHEPVEQTREKQDRGGQGRSR